MLRTPRVVAAARLLLLLAAPGCVDEAPVRPLDPQVPIVVENRLGGSGDWYAGERDVAQPSQLALWASPYSAGAGETLDVFIHTTNGPVAVWLFRLGWYGGSGGRLVWRRGGVAAAAQPPCTPALPGPVQCPWQRTLALPTDPAWLSGLYLLKTQDQSGKVAFYPLVLRDGRAADIVAVVPLFTWQAYNAFGGSSFYVPPGSASTFVSFERPYKNRGGMGGLLPTDGTRDFWVIQWLERNGYNVSYVSDLELASAATTAFAGRVLLFLGHDEYWTWNEYDRVQQLRDAGVHLAFFSGNNAYWNIRLGPGAVTGRPGHNLTCFKSRTDPGATRPEEVTTQFRLLGRPENGLYGEMYQWAAAGYAMRPLVVADSGVGPEAAAFLAEAGLQAGDQVQGGIEVEGDQLVANGAAPQNLQVLFRSPIPPQPKSPFPPYFYTTFFIAPSGAGVFASGSNEYAKRLSPLSGPTDARLDRLTRAVLDWMLQHSSR